MNKIQTWGFKMAVNKINGRHHGQSMSGSISKGFPNQGSWTDWPFQQMITALNCTSAQLQTSVLSSIITFNLEALLVMPIQMPIKTSLSGKNILVLLIGFYLSSSMKCSNLTDNLTLWGQDGMWRSCWGYWELCTKCRCLEREPTTSQPNDQSTKRPQG